MPKTSSKPKFTKGPLVHGFIDKRGGLRVQGGIEYIVAQMEDDTLATCTFEADAILYSTAPDLYKELNSTLLALKRLRTNLRRRHPGEWQKIDEQYTPRIKRIERLLARARGEN